MPRLLHDQAVRPPPDDQLTADQGPLDLIEQPIVKVRRSPVARVAAFVAPEATVEKV